jgi:putative heme-binding domain-containing protein
VDLGSMDAAGLSRTLEHPNAWWRETAQRLLVERRDRSAIPLLRTIAESGRSEAARIHALWTLDGLGGLERADVAGALEDRHAAVRENAIQLAETRLNASKDLVSHLLRLADDSDDRVRFRVALALGETDDPRAIPALATLARRGGTQSWVRAAVLSSVRDRSNELFRAFAAASTASASVSPVMQDLGQVLGAGQTPERCLELIVQIADPEAASSWQAAALFGIAQGLQARGLGRDGRSAFMTLLSSDSEQARSASQRVRIVLARASALALDEQASAELRLGAIGLLGHTNHAAAGRTLESLLAPQQPSQIQLAAVRALSQLPEPAAAASLVAPRRWSTFTPETREAVLSALLTDDTRTVVLLDALETGAMPPASIGSSRRNRLMNHRNAAIQKRGRALFAAVESGDRMQAYERLRGTVLARTGSATSGQRIFASHCATCHTLAGTGAHVGPDLSGIRNQPAEAILLHVLVPDYEIAAGYHAYNVETRAGRTLFGRLESEAPNSLTLRDASSQSHVILRNQVVSIKESPISLMPNELERAMTEQELADLIAYLKTPPR